MLAIGAFCGALPGGLMAEKIGRRYSSMALGVPFLISWAFIIPASSAGMHPLRLKTQRTVFE